MASSMANGKKQSRILDFDEQEEVEVRLGGRTFTITESHRAAIERILVPMLATRDTDPNDKRPYEQILFDEWETALPVVAAMLGVDETRGDHPEVVEHLRQYLRIKPANEIVAEWWRINNIDDFLAQGGRLVMPPDVAQEMRRMRQESDLRLVEAMQEAMAQQERPEQLPEQLPEHQTVPEESLTR